jgi:hypothetical protein
MRGDKTKITAGVLLPPSTQRSCSRKLWRIALGTDRDPTIIQDDPRFVISELCLARLLRVTPTMRSTSKTRRWWPSYGLRPCSRTAPMKARQAPPSGNSARRRDFTKHPPHLVAFSSETIICVSFSRAPTNTGRCGPHATTGSDIPIVCNAWTPPRR